MKKEQDHIGYMASIVRNSILTLFLLDFANSQQQCGKLNTELASIRNVIGLFSFTDRHRNYKYDMDKIIQEVAVKDIFQLKNGKSKHIGYASVDVCNDERVLLETLTFLFIDVAFKPSWEVMIASVSDKLAITLFNMAYRMSYFRLFLVSDSDVDLRTHILPVSLSYTHIFPFSSMLYFLDRIRASTTRKIIIIDLQHTKYERKKFTDVPLRALLRIPNISVRIKRFRISDNFTIEQVDKILRNQIKQGDFYFIQSNVKKLAEDFRFSFFKPLGIMAFVLSRYDFQRREIVDYCIKSSFIPSSLYNLSSCKEKRFVSEIFLRVASDKLHFGFKSVSGAYSAFRNAQGYMRISLDEILNVTDSIAANIATCSEGMIPRYGTYKDKFWSLNFGHYCKLCEGNKVQSKSECFPCEQGYRANKKKTQCIDFYQTTFLSFRSNSGLVILVASGLLFVSICLVISLFTRYWNTPVVRSSNRPLVSIQLLCILSLFIALPLLFLTKPDKDLCTMRPIVIGVLLTISTTITLSRTQTVLGIFTRLTEMSGLEKNLVKAVELFYVVVMLFIDICLSLVLFNGKTGSTLIKTEHGNELRYLYCSTNNIVFGQLVYVSLILLANAVQGFRARRLPQTYKETNVITLYCFVSMIMLISMGSIYYSQQNDFEKEVVLSYAVLLLNAFNLIFLYGPRVRRLTLKRNKNTSKYFRTVMQQKASKNLK